MTTNHRGKFEPLEAIAEGVTYRLFGVTHVHRAEPLYRKEMEKYTFPGDFWLYEQNLDRVLPQGCKAIPMPDHTAVPTTYYFLRGLNLGLSGPKLLALAGYYNLFPQRTFQEVIDEIDYLKSKERLSNIKSNERLSSPTALKLSRENVMCLRRSAYQAEFMRAYKKGKNKNVAVGFGHVRQIAFYLRQPTEEGFIYRQAQQHAALAEQEPQELERIIRQNNIIDALLTASGLLLGLQPYILTAAGISKFFSP